MRLMQLLAVSRMGRSSPSQLSGHCVHPKYGEALPGAESCIQQHPRVVKALPSFDGVIPAGKIPRFHKLLKVVAA